MRRAQGLSLNVVIIAAIALLVLVILAVILSRSGAIFSKQTTNGCVANGGECAAPTSQIATDPANYVAHPEFTCPTGQTCYVYQYG